MYVQKIVRCPEILVCSRNWTSYSKSICVWECCGRKLEVAIQQNIQFDDHKFRYIITLSKLETEVTDFPMDVYFLIFTKEESTSILNFILVKKNIFVFPFTSHIRHQTSSIYLLQSPVCIIFELTWKRFTASSVVISLNPGCSRGNDNVSFCKQRRRGFLCI